MAMPQSETQLEALGQARYERQLLAEITKLQGALAEERTMLHTQKTLEEGERSAEQERKAAAA